MKRLLGAAALLVAAGCASEPQAPPYDAARQTAPRGTEADAIRAEWSVGLFGSWDDVELRILRRALSVYPGKDLSGIGFYRLPRMEERGARYDDGKIGVYEVTEDALVHEIAHATHARAPGFGQLKEELQRALDFGAYHRTSFWSDGTYAPRAGFVTPYASMNVEECVAESITAIKLWAFRGRGPLGEVNWSDPKFDRVYQILDAHSLLGEKDREALANLRKRR
ncbi:MAG: hypothetical protein HYY18_02565 [Planctomycetes bacterium]|nr:hypothetical protein [Planctomycetota bacterium]